MDKNSTVFIITNNNDLGNNLSYCLDSWGYKTFKSDYSHDNIFDIARISPNAIIMDIPEKGHSAFEFCNKLNKNAPTSYIPIIAIIDKKDFKEHILDLAKNVDDYIIKPLDPLELKVRIQMTIKRYEHSFYANPLTSLPGGLIIENTLKDKITSEEAFVVGHFDIDNFKSFNDKYGYAKGDRVIMQTSYMLNDAIKKWGNSSDFVGHIGGDDFVIITTPDKYNGICENFICMFDTVIPFQYLVEDRKKGHIIVKDRTGHIRKTPIMSMTIALVLKNSASDITGIIELNERITEVKKYLKKISGSKYLADRRITEKNDYLRVQVFKNDRKVFQKYKPLGQILMDKKIITVEELDKALKIHWKQGALLGEVLEELGYVDEKVLSSALECQQESLS